MIDIKIRIQTTNDNLIVVEVEGVGIPANIPEAVHANVIVGAVKHALAVLTTGSDRITQIEGETPATKTLVNREMNRLGAQPI